MKMLRLICILSLMLGMFSLGVAQETKRIATIAELKGTVEVNISKGTWVPAKVGMVLNQGDMLRTKANSRAVLDLDGKAQSAIIEVKANSQLKLAELIVNKKEDSQKTLLDLALGEILIKVKKISSEKSSFEVKTPTSIVGVRGTTFAVTVKAVQ